MSKMLNCWTRRLTAEEAQQRRKKGQALSNDLLGGQSKAQTLSMVETYYKVLTGESLDVFGTGKSATSNNIADDPADGLLFFNSLGSDYRLARRRCSCHFNPRIKQHR